MQICSDHRGVFIRQEYLSQTRVQLVYDLPLAEIIYDFYDKLKSPRRLRHAQLRGHRLRRERARQAAHPREQRGVDALSTICHKDQAEYRGRATIKKLRKEIPRHLFEIPIQAACGNRIIARENIAALRKDVLAKCYGGDVTRKRKLLEKQKEASAACARSATSTSRRRPSSPCWATAGRRGGVGTGERGRLPYGAFDASPT
jgi:GTP-binding protein LepA